MSDPKWVDDWLDALDGVESGWWASIEEMDAREEAEHGPERAQSWKPEWVKLRERITYGRDEKNLASSNEREENQW